MDTRESLVPFPLQKKKIMKCRFSIFENSFSSQRFLFSDVPLNSYFATSPILGLLNIFILINPDSSLVMCPRILLNSYQIKYKFISEDLLNCSSQNLSLTVFQYLSQIYQSSQRLLDEYCWKNFQEFSREFISKQSSKIYI